MFYRFICLYLLFVFSAYTQEELLKVEQSKITLSNSQLLQYSELKNQKNFDLQSINTKKHFNNKTIQVVGEKAAIETSLLQEISGLEILTTKYSGHIAIELELYIKQDSDIEDVLFLYASSNLTERDTPLVFNLKNLKRDVWLRFQLWVPDFASSKGEFPDLQITNPYRLRTFDIGSPLKGEARKVLSTVKTLSEYKGVYLHSISIKKSNLESIVANEKAIIKTAIQTHPSHFDRPITQFLLGFFLIISFCYLFLKIRSQIGAKILMGFLVPITLSVLFLSVQGINDLMSSIEDSELYKIQTSLNSKAIKLNQTGSILSQSFVEKLEVTLIPKLKNLIDSFDAKGIQLDENLFAKAKIEKFKDRLNISNPVLLPKHPRFTYENTFDMQLQEIVDPYNYSIMLSNGSTIYFSNNHFVGKTMKHITTMFHKHISNETQNSRHKNNNRVQLRLIKEVMTQHLTNSAVFGKFMNQPTSLVRFQKMEVESNRSLSKVFWTHFTHKDKLWVIFGGVRKIGLLQSIQKEVNKVLKHPDSILDEYLFHGSNLINNFSSQKYPSNEMLEIATLAKKNRTLSFFPKFSNNSLNFYTYNIFSPNDEYSFVLKRSGEAFLKTVQTNKNYLYYSIYLLVILIYTSSKILSYIVLKPFIQLSKSMKEISKSQIGQDIKSTSKDQFAEVTYLLNFVLKSLREKQYISKFLSNMVKTSINQSAEQSTRQDQYILFCGIQNLKELEKSLNYKQLAQLIDEFLKQVQSIITEHQGRIDKFTGKSSLSVFSAKLPPKTISQLLQRLHKSLSSFEAKSNTTIQPKFGVGLAYGSVVLGHVGSKQRKDYTAIGSTVNKAARLEALASSTKDFVNIYFDQESLNKLTDTSIQYRSGQTLTLKGYEKKQEVYELL
ncbi:MAG: adenylate/guanylate cyclase domain-containing protein [Candidatus Cloacimonetes bacterium]|nr:adenylate/guanylate cyclase domain-containing protein [Candidatus Cloacimonadota bacterium]